MSTAPPTEDYVHPDEARMAAVRRIFDRYFVLDEDIYPGIARRFLAHGVTRFAEIGGGRGPIATILADNGVEVIVVDKDEMMAAEWNLRGVPSAQPRRRVCRLIAQPLE